MRGQEEVELDRLRRIVEEAKRKPNGNGHAGERPTILVVPGERPRAAREGLAAMAEAGTQFFRRYKDLVWIVRIEAKDAFGGKLYVPAADPVSPDIAEEALSAAADWQKTTKKGGTTIDPPPQVVKRVLALIHEWPFPPLRGVIATPTLRPDGSILDKPGYDDKTGFYLFEPPAMEAIPAHPTRDDAVAALELLTGLIEEFRFARDEGTSRSAAVALLMTPVLRAAMPVVPMFVITKPEAGTGGTYLVNLASMIATGELAPVLALSTNPEENEKRLGAAALAQHPVIALDNVSMTLEGDFLCQVTEQPRPRVRRLGASELVTIDNSFTVIADGNQVEIRGDMVRRTVRIELDADMEDPDTRTFDHDPIAEVQRGRGRYVAAILTIARAYASAAYPGELTPKPSYKEWSRLVRSALKWLDLPDPCAGTERLRAQDPIRQNRAIVFDAWINHLKPNLAYTTSGIIEKAREHGKQDLWDALIDVARSRAAPEIDPTKLGQWLGKTLNTVAHKHKLTVDRSDKKRPKWKLEPWGGVGG